MRRLYLSVYRPGRSLIDTWIGDMLVRLDSVMLFKRTVNSKLVEGFDCIIYYLRLDRCTIFYEHILPLGNDSIVELQKLHNIYIGSRSNAFSASQRWPLRTSPCSRPGRSSPSSCTLTTPK